MTQAEKITGIPWNTIRFLINKGLTTAYRGGRFYCGQLLTDYKKNFK